MADVRSLQGILRDLDRWYNLQHKNILSLRGFYFDRTNFTYAAVVTNWQENGDVLAYVEVRRNTDGDQSGILKLVRFPTLAQNFVYKLCP